MGRRVLNVTHVTGAPANVSLHAWCPGADAGAAAALVVAYTNPTAADVPISVAGVADAPRVEFALTATAAAYTASAARGTVGAPRVAAPPRAPPASMSSDAAFLNGGQLVVDAAGVLPAYPVPGKRATDAATPFTASPYSYGYVVFEGARPPACG